MSTARDGAQALIASLFSLPTTSSDDGPLAQLPPPVTQLPRAKPLPKPKPPTKWEQFAKAKGIQKKRKDKKIWDEEKQDWVNRWGWKGKNKEKEVQWATEVPANAGTLPTSSVTCFPRTRLNASSTTDVDYDPAKAARDERKARMAKNERQHQQNLARAALGSGAATTSTADKKRQIDRTLAVTRTSTASMGRFDRTLEGEKKLKGVKRKVCFGAVFMRLRPVDRPGYQFDPTEISADREKSHNLDIISKLDKGPTVKKAKRSESGGDDVLNVRKAIRSASKGKGSAALARSSSGQKGKGKAGKR